MHLVFIYIFVWQNELISNCYSEFTLKSKRMLSSFYVTYEWWLLLTIVFRCSYSRPAKRGPDPRSEFLTWFDLWFPTMIDMIVMSSSNNWMRSVMTFTHLITNCPWQLPFSWALASDFYVRIITATIPPSWNQCCPQHYTLCYYTPMVLPITI